MKKLFLLFILPVVLFSNSNQIKIYTENYPPYNYKKDGKLHGIAIDVLEEMLKQMNSKISKDDIVLTSWSRAYNLALKKKDNLVSSTTRTDERENLFKWVGPIIKTKIGLLALKDKNIKIKNQNELNKYTIGAVLKDIGEQLVLKAGVSKDKISTVSGIDAIELSYKKLDNDRIDLFAYETNVASYIAREKNMDLKKYETVYILSEGELYFAFNKNTDDKIIKSWQKALDTIKADGRYKKIISKYEK